MGHLKSMLSIVKTPHFGNSRKCSKLRASYNTSSAFEFMSVGQIISPFGFLNKCGCCILNSLSLTSKYSHSEAVYTLDWSCFSVSLITIISFSSRFSRFKSPSELQPAASYGIKRQDSCENLFWDFFSIWPPRLLLQGKNDGFPPEFPPPFHPLSQPLPFSCCHW